MADKGGYPAGFGENDILFECPECGKSLGIDGRGAGLVVKCPDCSTRMQVPVPPQPAAGTTSLADYTRAAELSGAEHLAEEKVHRMEVSLQELETRRRYLEKLRVDHALRFEKMREEMATIQSALDRMVDAMQDLPPDQGGRRKQA